MHSSAHSVIFVQKSVRKVLRWNSRKKHSVCQPRIHHSLPLGRGFHPNPGAFNPQQDFHGRYSDSPQTKEPSHQDRQWHCFLCPFYWGLQLQVQSRTYIGVPLHQVSALVNAMRRQCRNRLPSSDCKVSYFFQISAHIIRLFSKKMILTWVRWEKRKRIYL